MTRCAKRSLLYEGSSAESYRKVREGTNTILALLGKFANVSLREKLMQECVFYPYRKPTQVSESRRLRHTGEGGLRNSAKKLSVSFAICSAIIYYGYNKSLSTDCLAKTQAPANQKMGSIGAETCPVLVS